MRDPSRRRISGRARLWAISAALIRFTSWLDLNSWICPANAKAPLVATPLGTYVFGRPVCLADPEFSILPWGSPVEKWTIRGQKPGWAKGLEGAGGKAGG